MSSPFERPSLSSQSFFPSLHYHSLICNNSLLHSLKHNSQSKHQIWKLRSIITAFHRSPFVRPSIRIESAGHGASMSLLRDSCAGILSWFDVRHGSCLRLCKQENNISAISQAWGLGESSCKAVCIIIHLLFLLSVTNRIDTHETSFSVKACLILLIRNPSSSRGSGNHFRRVDSFLIWKKWTQLPF